MMFLNAMIALSMLGAVMSATISSQKAGQKVAPTQTHLEDYITDALKSDRFVPVGSHANKALEGTVYSLTGSVHQNLYYLPSGANDSTCSNEASVFGYPVNRCLLKAGFAFKLQLTQNSCTGLVIQYYSDIYCQNYIGLSQGDDLSQGECLFSNKDYDPAGSFVKYQCTTSAAVPLIADGVGTEYFNTVDCSGSLTNYGSLATGKCLALYDSPTNSFSYAAFTCDGGTITVTDYTTSDCTTIAPGTEPASIEYTCMASSDDNTNDDNGDEDDVLNPPPSASTTPFPTITQNGTSSNFFCPQNAPTLQPVFVPTAFPTSATAQQVTFDIKQQLNGIAAATLLSSTTSLYVLKYTIASTMTGVTPDDIINFEATDYSTGRRLGASLFTVGSSNIVRLTYTVSAMSIYSQTQLVDMLYYAVYSGAFTTDLNTNAQASTATDLYDCSSPNIIEPADWDLDVDDNLSGGAIAGIVIGCVVFVLLVGAIVYYCFCRRPSSPMSTHGTTAGAKGGKGGVEL